MVLVLLKWRVERSSESSKGLWGTYDAASEWTFEWTT